MLRFDDDDYLEYQMNNKHAPFVKVLPRFLNTLDLVFNTLYLHTGCICLVHRRVLLRIKRACAFIIKSNLHIEGGLNHSLLQNVESPRSNIENCRIVVVLVPAP